MIKKIILRNKIFFLLLTKKTKGMMGATKYYKLYNYANIAARTGSIIEIGAGSGSSTIALALGVKDINKAYTITTFEKCEGGSRCVYGDKADNNKMLIENFKFFNVSHNIYIKDMDYNDLTASELQSFSRLSLLFSDADGEIGRQFKLFYNKILPGGYIIIDDYSYKKNFQQISERYPKGGGKTFRTYCYINYFLAKGMLEILEYYNGTLFCRKPVDYNKSFTFDSNSYIDDMNAIFELIYNEHQNYLDNHK